jgi:hypothetical protein
MRYIINDDDFEAYIEILEGVRRSLDVDNYDLEYFIDAMKEYVRYNLDIISANVERMNKELEANKILTDNDSKS